MWLLNTQSLRLQQVNNPDVEPYHRYAILSHRWEDISEEPDFQRYHSEGPSKWWAPWTTARVKKGEKKVAEFCKVARQEYDVDFVWVDTCCIDKRSSAELQEAINSMYTYYKRAAVCCVYLRDVNVDSASGEAFEKAFVQSEWFTRGWTLQELLAPADADFFDCNWRFLGTKEILQPLITAATKIPCEILLGTKAMLQCPVAQRMSWAAHRQTTRVEDRAYSLLGIFNVNMPMLYGEGTTAFLRLQLEIIKTTDDHSIFVWRGLQNGFPGLLAPSPDAFESVGEVRKEWYRDEGYSFAMNNRGLQMTVSLIPYTLDTYLMWLSCHLQTQEGDFGRVGLFLRRLHDDDQFARVAVSGEDLTVSCREAKMPRSASQRPSLIRSISIRQTPLLTDETGDLYLKRIQGFRLGGDLVGEDVQSVPNYCSRDTWSRENRIVYLPPGSMILCRLPIIDAGPQKGKIPVIQYGFDLYYNPIVLLAHRTPEEFQNSEQNKLDYFEYKQSMYSTQEDFRFFEQEVIALFKKEHHNGIPISWKSRGDKYHSSRVPLCPQVDYFVRGMAVDEEEWSLERPLFDGTGRKIALAIHGSVFDWALKADRLAGLNVFISQSHKREVLPLFVDEPIVGHVRLSRATIDGRVVWDLVVNELAQGPERDGFEA